MTLADPKVRPKDIRDATSVVLYRTDPFEVYMVLRPKEARFFPDHWSVPGGAVDPEDGAAGSVDAFKRAGLRELGEELRVDVSGVDPGELVMGGRAVTPPFHTIRFSAQYVLLETRPEWEPSPDPDELAGGDWFTPDAVIDKWSKREMKLPPPILFLVKQLTHEDGLARLAAYGTSEHRFPIEMAPGLRLVPLETDTLPPARHTNCYIIGKRDLAIIDPGASGPDLQPLFDAIDWLINEEGCRVGTVLLTHHHSDHVAGAAEVAARYDVPVAAHPRTARRLEPGLVDFTFKEGKEVALDADTPDEMVLEVIHTPGHTDGHLAFLVRPHNSLIAGDLVATHSTIVIEPDEGDMTAYMESLARCVELAPEAVFPSHGPPTIEGVKLLQGTLDHRRGRENLVLASLDDEERSLDDLVPVVYSDTPSTLWPLARLSLEAHLIKLEGEGRAKNDGGRWSVNLLG